MPKGSNGEKEIDFKDLPQDEKLEVIMDAILDLVESQDDLRVKVEELVEKVNDMNGGGVDPIDLLDRYEFDN